jgi:superfamily II DNA helicase RecQ
MTATRSRTRLLAYSVGRTCATSGHSDVGDSRRRDVLVVMPTGSGKSAIYPVPAVLFDLYGYRTLVVDAFVRNAIGCDRVWG